MVWPLASSALAMVSPSKPSMCLPSKLKATGLLRSIQRAERRGKAVQAGHHFFSAFGAKLTRSLNRSPAG